MKFVDCHDPVLVESMRRLWKETFHDSDEYVNLIYDKCFYPHYCECCVDDTCLISSLTGVPYSFHSNDNSRDEIHGLYLCGLATVEQHRGEGIMSEMVLRAEKRAKENGFAFTFLIPADNGLRRYYERLGYYTSCRDIMIDAVVRINPCKRDIIDDSNTSESTTNITNDVNINSIKSTIINDYNLLKHNIDLLKSIIQKCQSFETIPDVFCIAHSKRQWRLILQEKFMSGCTLLVGMTRDGLAESAIVLQPCDEADGRTPVAIPLFGEFGNLGELLIDYLSRTDYQKKIRYDDTEGGFRIRIRIPEYSVMTDCENSIFEKNKLPDTNIEISEKLNFGEFVSISKVETLDYGMVKWVGGSDKRDEPVVFRLMLD